MNRQELDRELGQPAAGELLESAQLARLAYNGPDGLPRVIPIGFHWNGEHIVICTATTAPKVRALSSRPQVAVTIEAGSTPSEAKSLQVRGTATIEISMRPSAFASGCETMTVARAGGFFGQ